MSTLMLACQHGMLNVMCLVNLSSQLNSLILNDNILDL